MIRDRRQIQIHAAPEHVFGVIETMPNKFPVYKILETKPFFFLRILFVDGLRSAFEAVRAKKSIDTLILQVGDSLGPFTLTVYQRPFQYWFTLQSCFFNCQTGYTLEGHHEGTTLHFDLIAENPGLMEKVWWFFIKPFHIVFAKKVLHVLQERAEETGSSPFRSGGSA
jgi:hypothetical protein